MNQDEWEIDLPHLAVSCPIAALRDQFPVFRPGTFPDEYTRQSAGHTKLMVLPDIPLKKSGLQFVSLFCRFKREPLYKPWVAGDIRNHLFADLRVTTGGMVNWFSGKYNCMLENPANVGDVLRQFEYHLIHGMKLLPYTQKKE